jgi:WD40 repeat protein
MCGHASGVRVFQAKDDINVLQASTGAAGNAANIPDLVFDLKDLTLMGNRASHTDIVSCMLSCEAKFYSGGYDRKLIIYESLPHWLKVHVVTTINDAHEAGITCMTYAKDAENAWIITGSFDRTIKLWSTDGNCLQRFDGFLDTVTGIAYVPPTQILWVSCNSIFPVFLDPRSTLNVRTFL